MGKVLVTIAVVAVLFAVATEATALEKRLRKNRAARLLVADDFPKCTAAGGSCLAESACHGSIEHNLCGAGALFCCVHTAAPSTPAPAPGAPPPTAYSAQGVDVSLEQSLDTMKCLLDPTHAKHHVTSLAGSGAIGPTMTAAQAATIKASRFDRFGIRTPLLDGKSPVSTIQNAITAGFAPANINVYFIDFKAAEGADATLARLKVQAAALRTTQIGMLWLDVETGPNYWTTNTATNCAYLTQLVADIQADRVSFPWGLGIYSGISTWSEKVGSACAMTTFRTLPFWYAAYTGKMDFSYFTSHKMVNGWDNANVCQWRGTTGFCGANVDFNIFH